MSAQTTAWIWDHSQVGGTAKLVQLALANLGSYGGNPTTAHYGSFVDLVNSLVDSCRMKPDEVNRALKTLETAGEIRLDIFGEVTVCHFCAMRTDREAVR
jgi:hypothetical protein